MVLVDSHGISRVPRYSGACPASRFHFVYGAITRSGGLFQRPSTMKPVDHLPALRPNRSYNPLVQARRFGLIRVRSPLLAESLNCFLFLWVLRWFTSPRCLPLTYGFSQGYPGMTQGGLPHSEISGSKPVCGSPKLIAAYHVLHRLLAPRHSPYALSSLTIRTRDPSVTETSLSGSRSSVLLDTLMRLGGLHERFTLRVWSVKTTVCRIFSCQRPDHSPCE